MRKLGWYAVSALVAALILGSVLLLAANLYVQSQAVQHRIRQALASALRMPVSIRKTTLSPWEGLRIDGIVARAAASSHNEPDFLNAESFRVRFALWPLLQRKFVVTLLWLDRPQVAWVQDGDGHWQFPPTASEDRHRHKTPAPGEPSASAAPEGTPAPVAAGTVPAVPPPPGASTRPPKHAEDFTVALDRFRLRHGNLDLLTTKRRPVGQFEDINLDGQLSDPRNAAGTLSFGKAWMPRVGIALTQFHSNFAYNRDEGLTLKDGTATLAGGSLTANYHLSTRETGSPFLAECSVDRVDVQKLLLEIGTRLGWFDGTLRGKISVSGLTDRADSHTATAKLELVNGRVKDSPFLRMWGDALRIEDLSHMQFKTAEMDCQLDGTVLDIDPLLLVSNDLKITAQGKYLADRDHLDLHARLVIDDAVNRQLPDFIECQFKPCAENETPGSRFIDFDVTGPLNNPKSDLYNRVVADPMKGFFRDLLAPKPKVPKDKTSKHPATPPPAATPDDHPPAESATPSPPLPPDPAPSPVAVTPADPAK